MLFKTLSAIASLLFASTAVTAVPIMGPVTIYTPAADYTNERSLYARAIQLEYQKSVSVAARSYLSSVVADTKSRLSGQRPDPRDVGKLLARERRSRLLPNLLEVRHTIPQVPTRTNLPHR
jgi:hypothetical protein